MQEILVADGRQVSIIDPFVPITPGADNVWRWVYQAKLPTLFIGDRLTVQAEHEFTNDAGFNTECVTAVSLTNDLPWYDEDLFGKHVSPTAGLFVCEPSGGDVSPEMHHAQVTRAGEVAIPTGYQHGSYLTFRVRSRSTAADGNGVLTIMPSGYGHMSWQLYRQQPRAA